MSIENIHDKNVVWVEKIESKEDQLKINQEAFDEYLKKLDNIKWAKWIKDILYSELANIINSINEEIVKNVKVNNNFFGNKDKWDIKLYSPDEEYKTMQKFAEKINNKLLWIIEWYNKKEWFSWEKLINDISSIEFKVKDELISFIKQKEEKKQNNIWQIQLSLNNIRYYAQGLWTTERIEKEWLE